jgi:hypothetical protein
MKRGYIYKLWSKKDNKLVYFGSTTRQVSKRIADHHYDYKKWRNGKYNFVSSFLIFETGDWDYMCMEHIDYEEPYELKNRERYYIETFDCVNKYIPNRSHKEYNKEYYDNNKELFKKKAKKYYDNNKEHHAEITKEYYEVNKQKIAEKKAEKVKCDCGCVVNRSSLSKHKKTQKHLKWLETQS